MNSYEQKQEARRERLLAASEKAAAKSTAHHKSSHDATAGIPFGQPILVGHHSEGRHRRALDKSWNQLGKAVAEDKRAKELATKAAAVGSGGISSDDPDAVKKLKVKLAKLNEQREFMKAANKAYRLAKKKGINGLPDDKLMVADVDEILAKVGKGSYGFITKAIQWVPAYAFEKGPYVGWPLSNLGANIRTVEKRIAELEAREAENRETTTTTYTAPIWGNKPVEVVENVEENRVQIIFPCKPGVDIRKKLKSHGFRWAPSQGAWQRQLTSTAIYYATSIVKEIAQ